MSRRRAKNLTEDAFTAFIESILKRNMHLTQDPFDLLKTPSKFIRTTELSRDLAPFAPFDHVMTDIELNDHPLYELLGFERINGVLGYGILLQKEAHYPIYAWCHVSNNGKLRAIVVTENNGMNPLTRDIIGAYPEDDDALARFYGYTTYDTIDTSDIRVYNATHIREQLSNRIHGTKGETPCDNIS